ncbi:MAG: alpha-N-arabinofuranosidase [Ruminococcaceae bacterium]|nr:alpha-N-arabinofuranosidase [Oscillospiraceae bacterium]
MSRIIVQTEQKLSKINRNIYGHFSEHLGHCIYGGIFVGKDSKIPNVNGMRSDVVEALKHIRIPVLRWPGGCFADEYHWRDGIGPNESRKKMVNTNWGGLVEDNSFGTHEFMELCRQLGCEPYINGNLGSGTVREMSEWVEYMTFSGISPMSELRRQNGREEPWKLKYFGVGNESWGGGGNMPAEYYSGLYRHYQTFLRNYGDNKLYKIACGPNEDDYAWTDTVMKLAGKYMDAISLHYYTVPGNFFVKKGSALDFDESEYYTTLKKALRIDEFITKHLQIMDRYDPEHKVDLVVDEWGTWYESEPGTNPSFLYQQNTMRDALVAALTLNIFNRHSDRIAMANIAQVVNVLQSVIHTDGEKMFLTPTYYVFDLFKPHQDATLVESGVQTGYVGNNDMQIPQISVSASLDAENHLNMTVVNTSLDKADSVECLIFDKKIHTISAAILTGKMNAHNTFEQSDNVHIQNFDDITVYGDGKISFEMPPCSVLNIEVL